jgi:PAS domain S-box-containing protein
MSKSFTIAEHISLSNYWKDNERLTHKLLEIILEHSFDGIILSDTQGIMFWANQSVERILRGIKNEEILGKTAKDLEKEGIILGQSIKILEKNPLMLTQKMRTGVELFVTSTKVFDDDGNFIGYVANLRDMTELSRLKKEMELTKDLSERYYQELQQLRERILEIDDIIIKSEKMRQVVEKALKVARNEINVLLTGESGVGKEIVAKIIHKTSLRNNGPFIQINCGAIPETLLESELFGYEKGAFTGASRQGKIGLMEMANNGTILFDEIGDLPMVLQVKLLRAIQEQVIYRIGSTQPIQLNIRIVAATNKNLKEMVAAGNFREDLYYRINVIPIDIPSLRERCEDILPLAFHFLGKFNKKHDTYKTFSIELCNALEEYHWPGNVRELENLIERIIVIADSRLLTPDCLPRYMFEEGQEAANKTFSPEKNVLKSLKQTREEAELKAIHHALNIFGTTRKAAKALQVDHSTIVRKLKPTNES